MVGVSRWWVYPVVSFFHWDNDFISLYFDLEALSIDG